MMSAGEDHRIRSIRVHLLDDIYHFVGASFDPAFRLFVHCNHRNANCGGRIPPLAYAPCACAHYVPISLFGHQTMLPSGANPARLTVPQNGHVASGYPVSLIVARTILMSGCVIANHMVQ